MAGARTMRPALHSSIRPGPSTPTTVRRMPSRAWTGPIHCVSRPSSTPLGASDASEISLPTTTSSAESPWLASKTTRAGERHAALHAFWASSAAPAPKAATRAIVSETLLPDQTAHPPASSEAARTMVKKVGGTSGHARPIAEPARSPRAGTAATARTQRPLQARPQGRDSIDRCHAALTNLWRPWRLGGLSARRE